MERLGRFISIKSDIIKVWSKLCPKRKTRTSPLSSRKSRMRYSRAHSSSSVPNAPRASLIMNDSHSTGSLSITTIATRSSDAVNTPKCSREPTSPTIRNASSRFSNQSVSRSSTAKSKFSRPSTADPTSSSSTTSCVTLPPRPQPSFSSAFPMWRPRSWPADLTTWTSDCTLT